MRAAMPSIRQIKVERLLLVTLSLGWLMGSGCASIPQKALDDADQARLGAEFASRCAPEEFAAAQRMLDRARELVVLKEYGQAEEAAKTAQSLFVKAKASAEANRAECEKRLAPKPPETGLKQPDFSGAATVDPNYKLEMIHFGFDDSTLGPEARATLERHTRWLKSNPEVKIQIAGHCDAAGSTEYNLALGERRAESVKKYLISMGLDEGRLSTISYGEELPMAAGSNEGIYQQNRRAEFTRR